jgi:hypothetical protein
MVPVFPDPHNVNKFPGVFKNKDSQRMKIYNFPFLLSFSDYGRPAIYQRITGDGLLGPTGCAHQEEPGGSAGECGASDQRRPGALSAAAGPKGNHHPNDLPACIRQGRKALRRDSSNQYGRQWIALVMGNRRRLAKDIPDANFLGASRET